MPVILSYHGGAKKPGIKSGIILRLCIYVRRRMSSAPIGIFDSGYGGLTVFRAIRDALPQHDYLYLGDNARAPYGSRSFESIHQYTWQCVQWMFAQGCPLVILACNTASVAAR